MRRYSTLTREELAAIVSLRLADVDWDEEDRRAEAAFEEYKREHPELRFKEPPP